MRTASLLLLLATPALNAVAAELEDYPTTIDLNDQTHRQVVVDREAGQYLAMFHDDGRFHTEKGRATSTFKLFKTFSEDGGLTWSFPEVVFQSSDVHLCEPGCIRSPDGKRIAVILRENGRRKNSHVIFSSDEGKTWSEPREVPLALTQLLPLADVPIKGGMRSRESLYAAVGRGVSPESFDGVLGILNSQLRLITPTAPTKSSKPIDDAPVDAAGGGRYYQLTHDYLVPSLRVWLAERRLLDRTPVAPNCRTHGVCSTCMVVSGNGALTPQILKGRGGAGFGTATLTTASPHRRRGSVRAGTIVWAFVSSDVRPATRDRRIWPAPRKLPRRPPRRGESPGVCFICTALEYTIRLRRQEISLATFAK